MICETCKAENCWLRGGLTLGAKCHSYVETEIVNPVVKKLDKLTKYKYTNDIRKDNVDLPKRWLLDYDDVVKFIKENI